MLERITVIFESTLDFTSIEVVLTKNEVSKSGVLEDIWTRRDQTNKELKNVKICLAVPVLVLTHVVKYIQQDHVDIDNTVLDILCVATALDIRQLSQLLVRHLADIKNIASFGLDHNLEVKQNMLDMFDF
jgi:hypothetical protein